MRSLSLKGDNTSRLFRHCHHLVSAEALDCGECGAIKCEEPLRVRYGRRLGQMAAL
jgi:hypothetical protein